MSKDGIVISMTLSNEYTGYTTTIEEYNEQYYEGAFTLFGPHTLNAYIESYLKLVKAFVSDKYTPNSNHLYSIIFL